MRRASFAVLLGLFAFWAGSAPAQVCVPAEADQAAALAWEYKKADAFNWSLIYQNAVSRNIVIQSPQGTSLVHPRDGTLLSVGTDGKVYRDGKRLGTATVSVLKVVGVSIYGKSLTNTAVPWWEWVGVSASVPTGWKAVSGVVELDPSVFN